MNLSEIQADIYDRMNFTTAPPTRVVNRIKRFINTRYRQILSMHGISQLRDATTTFETEAEEAVYTLPAEVARVRGIYDPVEGRKLIEASLQWVREVAPTPNIGTPTHYAPVSLDANTRLLTIELYPTPASNTTYYVDYTREITELANTTDTPLLPTDFHYLLSLGARIDEYEHQDDERALAMQQEWLQGIRRLLFFVVNTPDYIIVPGGNEPEWSSLGPNFPAGS